MCCDDFIFLLAPAVSLLESQSTHTALFLLQKRWKHFLNDLWPIFLPRALHLIPDGHLWLVSERNVVTAQSEASLGISAIGSYLSMPQASVRCQNNMLSKLQGTHIKSSSGPLKSALASLEGKEEGEHCRTGVEYHYGSSSLQRNLFTNFLPPPLS